MSDKPLKQYLQKIDAVRQSGKATEHSYRAALQTLLESLQPEVQAINEPARLSKVGAPDFLLQRPGDAAVIGCIETKDIGDADLYGKSANKEQFDRYKSGVPNCAFTDYLQFVFYRNAEYTDEVAIARVTARGVTALPENFDRFIALLTQFAGDYERGVSSAEALARTMAGNARLLADIITNAIDADSAGETDLTRQRDIFKELLIHDLTTRQFADIYAQTIAYGMLAARLHAGDDAAFTRKTAAEFIPKSSPFIRKLFIGIAGPDIDERIVWIVDLLADIFAACDAGQILQKYGDRAQSKNPVIHFYETFLAAYDPQQRKLRGVWYTPEAVVGFIVRSVDEVLQQEFGIAAGLADSGKTVITAESREKEVHRVQLLDPAAGTGAFLAEVIDHIHSRQKDQQGTWSDYVEEHLLPRLNGFELLMASYAMAHLQLDLLLQQTGYQPINPQRFRVYLTNSLEEHSADSGDLFSTWLTDEIKAANYIKREAPIMCVLGNPPYLAASVNKGKWIMNLMEDYKKEPGGREKLRERNPKWINDDYVKFMRYGQHFIEKNGSGALAFINPHGFLDNSTFRGMRWNLLAAYDKLYILDLHGNARKKETAPDGGADENVFDIMQGVSINIFIKTGKKKAGALGEVYHCDLYGAREAKYDFLNNHSISTVEYKKLPNKAPMYFMTPKDYTLEAAYKKGFSVNDLFTVKSVGIVTSRDAFSVKYSRQEIEQTIERFLSLPDEQARREFNLGKDAQAWTVADARKDLQRHYPGGGYLCRIAYRLFDSRWTFYTGNSKGFHYRPAHEIMQHFLKHENAGLALCRQYKTGSAYQHVFITDKIIESSYVSNRTSEITSVFPLYTTDSAGVRGANLNRQIAEKIAAALQLSYSEDEQGGKGALTPMDILDYVYAVLHSPVYRSRYAELLKTDFPYVPYPRRDTFRRLAELGGELRALHLMKASALETLITAYPAQGGDNTVTKVEYKDGRVYINPFRYFDGVTAEVWNFRIGGYQPAQKWLKDRKNRALTHEDSMHYQKIIVCLNETMRIMNALQAIEL